MCSSFRPAFMVLALALATHFGMASAAQPSAVEGQPASILPNVNKLTAAEKAAGWELLFDGKTTNGRGDREVCGAGPQTQSEGADHRSGVLVAV
jgi:hypothetical protein